MTHRPITLKRWHPLHMAVHRLTGPSTVTFDAEPPIETLLVDLNPRMANERNLVTLYRAAQVNGLADSLFEPHDTLEGQPWYDRLPRIVAMDTEAFIDGEQTTFTWTDDATSKDGDMQQIVAALHGGDNETIGNWSTWEIDENLIAESIAVRILVRSRHGTEARQLRTDFGVGSEFTSDVQEAGIIVSPDCELDVKALKNLIAEAIFEYSYDEKDDSPETQWLDFMDNAHTVAAKLLLNEHEAAAESIRHAARTHLGHLLPDDRTVQPRKQPVPGEGIADVNVVLPRDDPAYAGK